MSLSYSDALSVITAANTILLANENASNTSTEGNFQSVLHTSKSEYATRRIRKGKTARDKAAGAKSKNAENKGSRVCWQHDSKATTANFPYASCNGKRNRYQVTGPGGEKVILRDEKKSK